MFSPLRCGKLALDNSDSIPLGNGDLAINLWAGENGDLLFYLAKSDALTERNHLVKLGRVRISMDPNPFRGPHACSLSLNIAEGVAPVRSGELGFEARMWVNAHSDHVPVDLRADPEMEIQVRVPLGQGWASGPVGAEGQTRNSSVARLMLGVDLSGRRAIAAGL